MAVIQISASNSFVICWVCTRYPPVYMLDITLSQVSRYLPVSGYPHLPEYQYPYPLNYPYSSVKKFLRLRPLVYILHQFPLVWTNIGEWYIFVPKYSVSSGLGDTAIRSHNIKNDGRGFPKKILSVSLQ